MGLHAFWTSALPFANVLGFILTVVVNGLSGANDKYHLTPASNKDVSDAHPTAFTPAGYAFAIWGIIYTFGGVFTVYQALPSHREWTVSKIGVLFLANLGANIVWLLVFGRGNKSRVALWLAAVILFGGILATLIALHISLGVHYGNAGVTTWEKWGAHVFISLYMGWTCVACVANVAIAFTPHGGPVFNGGLGAHVWSILLQIVVVILGATLCVRGDYVAAIPIAWALGAIASKQRSGTYTGASNVASCASVLAIVLAVWIVYSALVVHGVSPTHWPFASTRPSGGSASLADKADGKPAFKSLQEL